MKRFLILFCFIQTVFYVNSEKVIIVGAGASGLAAATRLIENNITDFIILEAQERLGGRIHSIYLDDGKDGGFVDLGGEYVGGEEGNVVYQFAKDALKHSDKSKKRKVFYSDGKQVDDKLSGELLAFKSNLRTQYEGKKPIAASEAFHAEYNKSVLEKYEKNPEDHQKAADFITTCENLFLYRRGAFDWSKILLNDHQKICKGDQEINWNGQGYKHFLNLLMRKFGDEHRLRLYPILYSTAVTKISWNNPKKVVVSASDGNEYTADHVIFTPSVGVLKEKHEELFTPKLPANKVDAIKATGFDAVVKVILQYNKKWWDDETSEIVLVWNKEDEETLNKGSEFSPKLEGKSWLNSFNELFTVPGMPNILVGWFTGPLVPEIEKLTSEKIGAGATHVIKKFLGKTYNVTEPFIVIPSTWYSNPNFRGTYSYETLASANRKRQTQEDLAESLLNKQGSPDILFAGEHTHKTHFASVHGAVESGYRAADELVAHLKKI